MVELLMETPALLFGPVIGLLVLLLLLLRIMGRRRKAADTVAVEEAVADGVLSDDEEPRSDEAMGNFTIIRRDDDNTQEAGETLDDANAHESVSETVSEVASEDATLPEWQTVSDAAIANADRLAAIEQEMLAVRDLYQKEQINRSVYVDETRALFEEAKSLTSD